MANTVLTREQEYDLGTRIQAGLSAEEKLNDKESLTQEDIESLERTRKDGLVAKTILCEHNIQLVKKCANIHWSKSGSLMDFEDFVQDGIPGLITAAEKFDPTRGNKFSTVAWPWINQSISRSGNKVSNVVRLPENRLGQFYQMKQIAKEMNSEIGNEAVMLEIERKMNLSRDSIQAIRNAGERSVSLNKHVGTDSEGSSKELIEMIEPGYESSADTRVINRENISRLKAVMDKLPPEQRDALMAEFGFESPLYDASVRKASRAKRVREHYKISIDQHRKNLSSALSFIQGEALDSGLNSSDF